MSKSVIKEGLIGRIAQLIFKGKISKFKKEIKNNKELAKATADFEKSTQKFQKVIDKYEKKAKKAGVSFKPGWTQHLK